jgi:DNA polymerase type B, organellar and viral
MADPGVKERVEDLIRARGTDFEHLIKDRHERERERKRQARKQRTPEQRERERKRDSARKRESRKHQTPEQRQREVEREGKRSRRKVRPFRAIDGEGGGTDELGRQNYFLMVASGQTPGDEYVLHRDGKALLTRDCLEFILSLPADEILVAFGIGYDTTQMLRSIRPPTLRQIMNPRQGKNGPRYTYWGDYAIIYQQGQYFRVARIDRSGPKPTVIKGSCRTIYETRGFFQCAFVKAIGDWRIGTEQERAIIAANKEQRDEFVRLTDTIIGYCHLECRYLALLMTEFREVCAAAGILPKQWSGAGWLAAALLDKHGIPKRPLTRSEIAAVTERKPGKSARPVVLRRPERDPQFEAVSNRAYYGGRFETSRIGLLEGPICQNDLNSAYPAAMPYLPCPLHTRWEHKPHANRLPENGIYLARISFSHHDGPWCGLPFRHKGGLLWPLQGTGWYWSPEIEAAQRHLQADVMVRDLWIAHQECDCQLFRWINELYEKRRQLGSQTRGYPIKLGLNSLYGKMAQRSGRGPYHDPVAAGLITAITRARLIEAIGQDPHSVVMVATDAVFSTRQLQLDVGEGLGQWEERIWPDLFIAQPGVYWSPSELEKTVKSRGAPRSVIGPAAPRFHDGFAEWLHLLRDPAARKRVLEERLIPSVRLSVRLFIGCRLATAWGKPWLAGKWDDRSRYMSFESSTKRDPMRIEVGDEGYLKTFPRSLSILAESEGYKPADFDRLIV